MLLFTTVSRHTVHRLLSLVINTAKDMHIHMLKQMYFLRYSWIEQLYLKEFCWTETTLFTIGTKSRTTFRSTSYLLAVLLGRSWVD